MDKIVCALNTQTKAEASITMEPAEAGADPDNQGDIKIFIKLSYNREYISSYYTILSMNIEAHMPNKEGSMKEVSVKVGCNKQSERMDIERVMNGSIKRVGNKSKIELLLTLIDKHSGNKDVMRINGVFDIYSGGRKTQYISDITTNIVTSSELSASLYDAADDPGSAVEFTSSAVDSQFGSDIFPSLYDAADDPGSAVEFTSSAVDSQFGSDIFPSLYGTATYSGSTEGQFNFASESDNQFGSDQFASGSGNQFDLENISSLWDTAGNPFSLGNFASGSGNQFSLENSASESDNQFGSGQFASGSGNQFDLENISSLWDTAGNQFSLGNSASGSGNQFSLGNFASGSGNQFDLENISSLWDTAGNQFSLGNSASGSGNQFDLENISSSCDAAGNQFSLGNSASGSGNQFDLDQFALGSGNPFSLGNFASGSGNQFDLDQFALGSYNGQFYDEGNAESSYEISNDNPWLMPETIVSTPSYPANYDQDAAGFSGSQQIPVAPNDQYMPSAQSSTTKDQGWLQDNLFAQTASTRKRKASNDADAGESVVKHRRMDDAAGFSGSQQIPVAPNNQYMPSAQSATTKAQGWLQDNLFAQTASTRKRKSPNDADAGESVVKHRRMDDAAGFSGSQQVLGTSNDQYMPSTQNATTQAQGWLQPSQNMSAFLPAQGEPSKSRFTDTGADVTEKSQSEVEILRITNDNPTNLALRPLVAPSLSRAAVVVTAKQKSKGNSAVMPAQRPLVASRPSRPAVVVAARQEPKGNSAKAAALTLRLPGIDEVVAAARQKSKGNSAKAAELTLRLPGIDEMEVTARPKPKYSSAEIAALALCLNLPGVAEMEVTAEKKSGNNTLITPSQESLITRNSAEGRILTYEGQDFRSFSAYEGTVGYDIYYKLEPYESLPTKKCNLNRIETFHASKLGGWGWSLCRVSVSFSQFTTYMKMCLICNKPNMYCFLEYMELSKEEDKKLRDLDELEILAKYIKLTHLFFQTDNKHGCKALKFAQHIKCLVKSPSDNPSKDAVILVESLLVNVIRQHMLALQRTTDLYPYNILLTIYILREYFLPVVLENVLLMLGDATEFDPKIKESTQTCEKLFKKIRAKVTEDRNLDPAWEHQFDYALLSIQENKAKRDKAKADKAKAGKAKADQVKVDQAKADKAKAVQTGLPYVPFIIDRYIKAHHSKSCNILNKELSIVLNKELSIANDKAFQEFHRLKTMLYTLNKSDELQKLYDIIDNKKEYLRKRIKQLHKEGDTDKSARILSTINECQTLQEKIKTELIPLIITQIFGELLKSNPDIGGNPKITAQIIKNILTIECNYRIKKAETLKTNLLTTIEPPEEKSFLAERLEQSMHVTPSLHSEVELSLAGFERIPLPGSGNPNQVMPQKINHSYIVVGSDAEPLMAEPTYQQQRKSGVGVALATSKSVD